MDPRERQLATRIRLDILVMSASFALQGAFLASALSSGEAGMWLAWLVVLVFACVCIVVAGRRASRLSKQYRRLKWGEK